MELAGLIRYVTGSSNAKDDARRGLGLRRRITLGGEEPAARQRAVIAPFARLVHPSGTKGNPGGRRQASRAPPPPAALACLAAEGGVPDAQGFPLPPLFFPPSAVCPTLVKLCRTGQKMLLY